MEMIRPLHKGYPDYYFYENNIVFIQPAIE